MLASTICKYFCCTTDRFERKCIKTINVFVLLIVASERKIFNKVKHILRRQWQKCTNLIATGKRPKYYLEAVYINLQFQHNVID